jgi:hypothetical protein
VATTRLEKTEWQLFFDRMSKALTGKRAEIEIDSLTLGHQIEAKSLPLLGMVYDPKSDVLEIALEGLDHMIPHPQQVFVEMEGPELTGVEIIDRDGLKQLVQLRDPLMLPPPSGAVR